jgi:hypothetical protein
LVTSTLSAQKTYYVNIGSGNDSNTGLKWSSAFQQLQKAVDMAQKGDTINVAAGKYLPTKKITEVYGGNYPATPTGDRHKTFLLVQDVKIFGGYPANETDATTKSDRNWIDNETILSGDLNGDDNADFTHTDENALHVVVMKDASKDMILDGFVVTNGGSDDTATVYYNNTPIQHSCGGGIYAISNMESSPTLSNLIIKNNKVTANGAAFYNYSNGTSAPKLTNVKMLNNMSGERGGAFYIDGDNTAPEINNSLFAGNSTFAHGGAILCVGNNVSPVFYGVQLSGNKANEGAGAYLVALGGTAKPVIVNTTICGNNAEVNGVGGGLAIKAANEKSSPKIVNTVIWGNGGGQYPDYCLDGVQSSDLVYDNNLIEGESFGGSNLTGATVPLFVNPVDAQMAPTTAGDYRLQKNSPLIDKGTNNFTHLNTDLAGKARIFNAITDIGAYEYQGYTGNDAAYTGNSVWSNNGILYVSVKSGNTTLKIYSLNGQLIQQTDNLTAGNHEYALPKGFYLVTVNNNEHYKILIQ